MAAEAQTTPTTAAASARPSTRLVIDKATKIYQTATGPLLALDSFSAEIGEGEFVCVVGPSGCGKTTLLWALSGLHPLTSGAITLDGTPVKGPRPEIGMVFQEANLLPWRNLMKNILFPFEIKRLDAAPYRTRIQHLLETVGLAGFENKFPRELSGGMQQRASLVRCLSFDPSVMLMDEPFGALDEFTRERMNMELLRIWQRTGITVIFVTHSIPEAVFLSSRVVVMSPRPGRITRVIDIDLPYPRVFETRELPRFFELVTDVREHLRDAHGG